MSGTVAPGTSPGILHIGSVLLNDGSTFAVELNGTIVGAEYDQLDVTGSAAVGGTLDASLGYEPSYFDKLFIIRNDGTDAVDGTFDGLDDGASLHLSHGGVDALFWISYAGDWDTQSITGGNDGGWGCLLSSEVHWLNLSTGASGWARLSDGLNGIPAAVILPTGPGQIAVAVLSATPGPITPGVAAFQVP